MSEAEKPHADRAVETSDTAGDGPVYAAGAAPGGKAKSLDMTAPEPNRREG